MDTENNKVLNEGVSQEMFKNAFDNSILGMALVSTKGRWLYANNAVCQMLGFSEEELLDKDFKDITYPDEVARDLEVMKKMVAGETDSYKVEKRYITKQGQTIWVSLYTTSVRDLNKQPLYFVTNIENINQRKIMEDKLKESERHFKAIFDNISICVSLNNLSDGKFTDINETFINTTGYKREEIIGKTSLDLDLWAVPEQRAEIRNQMNEHGKSKKIETQWHRKSGELIDVSIDTVVMDIDGEKYYLGLIDDITERKKTQVELSEKVTQLEKFNKILVERELKMIELKEQITKLEGEKKE